MSRETEIRNFYRRLLETWGPQDWWPAHSSFEVIAGAYLTQNTAWSNVERALRRLRDAGALNVAGIRAIPLRELEKMIRSAGYFRQKARRLKNFVTYLDERHGGSLRRMFSRPTEELRQDLLELNGVGPETADSILLYAGGHPVFVVDAYTRRIFERHDLLRAKASYEEIRVLVERALNHVQAGDLPPANMKSLPGGARRRHKFVVARSTAVACAYNEFHALLVQAAKHHCLKSGPLCDGCPLERFLPVQSRKDKKAGKA